MRKSLSAAWERLKGINRKGFLYGLFSVFLANPVQATSYYHRADALDKLRIAYDRNDPEIKAAYFRGYVTGIADNTHGSTWCPPSNVNAERIYGIVSKYMKEHLATVNEDAVAVVIAALGESFPCRNK
ncbi:hypothetical protein CCP3SC1_30064 [Gammaproteobacteria bacterium]